jgi:hypothetical protein
MRSALSFWYPLLSIWWKLRAALPAPKDCPLAGWVEVPRPSRLEGVAEEIKRDVLAISSSIIAAAVDDGIVGVLGDGAFNERNGRDRRRAT